VYKISNSLRQDKIMQTQNHVVYKIANYQRCYQTIIMIIIIIIIIIIIMIIIIIIIIIIMSSSSSSVVLPAFITTKSNGYLIF